MNSGWKRNGIRQAEFFSSRNSTENVVDVEIEVSYGPDREI
jgi:hypothetical protein